MEFTTSMPTITNQSNTSYSENSTRGYSGGDRIPAFVYSVTLTILGIIGNSHALIVNGKRFRSQMRQPTTVKNPYVVFVLSLAILDTFTCLVILPMDNADLSTTFTPFSDTWCKIFRYLQFVVHVSSVLHIVLISIHCWRQVCHPHARQLNRKYAIRFCLFFDIVATIGAVIVVFLSGNNSTTIEGITGPFCYIGERNKNPMFLRISMGILSVGFIVCLIIICASYFALIANRWRSMKTNAKTTNNGNHVQKTTATLIILTAIFVIAYIPFMVLAIIKAVDKQFQRNLRGASAAAHGIFIRFPLINNVVNPFVYGFKDAEFRKRLLEIYPCLKCSKKQNGQT